MSGSNFKKTYLYNFENEEDETQRQLQKILDGLNEESLFEEFL